MRLNKIDVKVLDATTLIQINQYKTDKQNSEKEIEILITKYKMLVYWSLLMLLLQKLKGLITKYLTFVV